MIHGLPTFEAFRGKFHRICPRGVFVYKNEELTATEMYSEIAIAARDGDKDPKSARFAHDMVEIFDIRQTHDNHP